MWMRMQVRFHADDNEPLAHDLARYDKGQRRVARLLTLATYGLVYLQRLEAGIPVQGNASNGPALKPAPPAPDTRLEDGYQYKMSAGDLADVFGD